MPGTKEPFRRPLCEGIPIKDPDADRGDSGGEGVAEDVGEPPDIQLDDPLGRAGNEAENDELARDCTGEVPEVDSMEGEEAGEGTDIPEGLPS